MSSSASSIDRAAPHPRSHARDERPSPHGRVQRGVARVLVAALVFSHPLAASAGDEFDHANQTSFDNSKVQLDNSQSGRTTFRFDQEAFIRWQEFHQPKGNLLEFIAMAGQGGSVLNYSESLNGIRASGEIRSTPGTTVAFANPYGVFVDGSAVIDVGNFVAIAGAVNGDAYLAGGRIEIPLTGRFENHGLIRADQNVALLATSVLNAGEILANRGNVLMIGGQRVELADPDVLRAGFAGEKGLRAVLAGGEIGNAGTIESKDAALLAGHVTNLGEIQIDDGSLLMVGADGVYVSRFDDPVLIRLPLGGVGAGSPADVDSNGSATGDGPRYAIENHGRIDAGRGHVRLAAADPLGFGIRQGTGQAGTTGAPAGIAARTIELEGGEQGRVQLSGTLDASDRSKKGRGGRIDVTGELIAVTDATIDASGTRRGGEIRIGGEQQGRGELQNARALVVDQASEIRADAIKKGDGGRVILFSEDLTSIDGEISAHGGRKGGNGGFVETSGLRHFAIGTAPDVSAPRGRAGRWLIDPYDITIQNGQPDCTSDPSAATCLDAAIEAILDPGFDSAGFDGILRTTGTTTNYVSADLIERALGIGTDITLSTQAFLDDPVNGLGDIRILDAITIDSARVLAGTTARLTLLAAGNIFVDAPIEVLPIGAGTGERSNLALSVELHANDAGQTRAGRSFAGDLVAGSVLLNADVRTGGGSFTATGIGVRQQAGRQILTRGGDVTIRTGTLSPDRRLVSLTRSAGDPGLDDDDDGLTLVDPVLELLGIVDTRTADGRESGGDVSLVASSVNLGVSQSGADPIDVVTGLLRMAGSLLTGGGDVTLAGGAIPLQSSQAFAGNVTVEGTIDTRPGFDRNVGGDVRIIAHRVNPDGNNGDLDVTTLAPSGDATRGQGGAISLDGTIRTGGGALAVGNDSAARIEADGILDTTRTDLLHPGNPRQNGLIRLVARNSTDVAANDDQPDRGRITLGGSSGITIATAGLSARTGELTTSNGAGNAVDVVVSGRSTSTFFDVTANDDTNDDDEAADQPAVGILDLATRVRTVLGRNTELSAKEIRVSTAGDPLDLPNGERPNGETRLVFGGGNGGGSSAADGVRLNADRIELEVGDGTTATSDLFAGDEGTLGAPTELGLQRQTRGDYRGLQLRDRSGAERPDEIEIRQDGDLRITQGAAGTTGELDLAGAFAGAAIGSDGLRLTLESSDGILRIDDAAGFNNDIAAPPTGDDGKSFVTLRGGLLLPPRGSSTDLEDVPSPNSVVFRDGTAELGDDSTTAFTVERLTVSTPGDLTIAQQIANGIAAVAELVFESGRDEGRDATAGRGSLTIAASTALTASRSLSLGAAGAGYGNLVFAGPGISLASNEIALRAGSTGNSRNDDANDRSRIVGLRSQDVALRDAANTAFGDGAASTPMSFRFRQAAAIDAAADLPSLLQFGLLDSGPGAGFRDTGDVVYAVRSDEGRIDLDDGGVGTNEADAFRHAALSLIGLQSGNLAAIDVSDDTRFVGKRVELGGVSGFAYNSELASAFNRDGSDADQSLTLRSGLGGSGGLSFQAGSSGSLLVKAPTIRLIAGDGAGEDSEEGSTIDSRGASFDLAGPGTDRRFTYQIDGSFRVEDLPGVDRFVGGSAGLPTVLALRNDGGRIEIDDFDVAELPLAVATGPARLVIEADEIELDQRDGDDLELTTNPNLFLRLRANVLSLLAFVSGDADTEDGRVRFGRRAGDGTLTAGTDDQFDGRSLLVEAFDRESEHATTGNLSAVSRDPDDAAQFDLASGRGPGTLTVTQDGSVLASDLADRIAFSGLLGRSLDDDAEGDPIATRYTLESRLSTVAVTPETVNGSRLTLVGTAPTPVESAIDFLPGASAGVFDLDALEARTEDSIIVAAGTQLIARDSIALLAGQVGLPTSAVTGQMGSLIFASDGPGGQDTVIEAHQVSLFAGPAFDLSNPDADGDGERDPIVDPNPPNGSWLPKLDLRGLDVLAVAGDADTSSLRLRQNGDFDARVLGAGAPGDVSDGTGDFLTALAAGGGGWRDLEVASLQGELRLSEIGLLADASSRLLARTGLDGRLVVDMPDQADRPAPFADFDDSAELRSNDITFQSSDPGTSIDLGTERLLLSSFLPATLVDPDSRDRLRRDLDPDEDVLRPIVRIHQAAAFANTELPLPGRYAVVNSDGSTSRRADLSGLDIELRTTNPGTTLVLDDGVRGRTTGSNLILRSAGDIAIDLTDPTPGYEAILDDEGRLQYAALQLATLDVEANGGTGTIRIAPFTIGAIPAELTVLTAGDQRFAGTLTLENSLFSSGRNLTFDGDIAQSGNPDAGLTLGTSGKLRFLGDVGSVANRLAHLRVAFQGDSGTGGDARTPTVEFGGRTDSDGDGIAETPVASNQGVFVRDDVRFKAGRFRSGEGGLALARELFEDVPGAVSSELSTGRQRAAQFATIGKALGDLTFDSANGWFETSAGEKLSVGGTLTLNTPNSVSGRPTMFSDVSALVFRVTSFAIQLLSRPGGVNRDGAGATQRDGGPSLSANLFDLNVVAAFLGINGGNTRLGVPNPFAPSTTLPLPTFGLRPGGRSLTTADFRFNGGTGALGEQVPFLVPTGASRSDLSGAHGPVRVPTSRTQVADPLGLADPDRLAALAIDARPTADDVVRARLAGGAVIDDRGFPTEGTRASVSEARLDASDAEQAIGLYRELFGENGERTGRIRGVLQKALDEYLEIHRAQRVVGFELRRFVKNRPSTLIEAYTTLEDLDALFRFHRRLGLSPGEFKRIQRGWLESIRPEGISVEELAETVHPSRYVRGSDILDIFGE